ncbi:MULTISPECIES: accessory gene regulator ArgB-like protein [Brevibacillus]|jgi:accessory gene regulator B|uniref:accessory gene regulator ArgB-like protein n=1 Tax=Brevibacillus TaxID=55080 RepID=UPI000F07DD87|nr:accessory gene regulator B family protein [Brevibacillus borstelensis]MBE5396850.1 accessory gene regulator B family protein [Brevibacillus borstelensis]MCM3593188.1 accessory gene regulator B family protein [Brevibacillus borstelensis]MED1873761.1 accessory gene regulator B family protein [Brevibacillus borstelensis]MED1884892.1 accessory gene regulator B family protein [Brevibacillus borstelensis]MED2007532.1 accessory gene regulator B family protein [Brevibacillus borstelensis]
MGWMEKTSKRIARKIMSEDTIHTEEELSHGIEIFLLNLLNVMFLFLVSILLGIVGEVFLLTTIYFLHRLFTGGVHMSTPGSCLIVGTATLSGAGYVMAHLPVLTTSLAYFWIVISMGAAFLINVKYAPAAHTYLPTNERVRQISKKVILFLITIGCTFILFLVVYYQKIALIYSLAVFLQSLHLHPVSYRMVAGLEQMLRKGGTL